MRREGGQLWIAGLTLVLPAVCGAQVHADCWLLDRGAGTMR
jgi:hypothetical protein